MRHRPAFAAESFTIPAHISLDFDQINLRDWPTICQETLRILNLVKEVKP